MSVLSGVYGVTVAIVAVLSGPVAAVAWIGAVVLGLGWSLGAMLPRPPEQAAGPSATASQQ